jgi:hypothetical protein
VQLFRPRPEQYRPFEHELDCVFGLAQPVQQSLDRVPGEHELELLVRDIVNF